MSSSSYCLYNNLLWFIINQKLKKVLVQVCLCYFIKLCSMISWKDGCSYKMQQGLARTRNVFLGSTPTPKSISVWDKLPNRSFQDTLWLQGGLLLMTYFDVRSFVINIWQMFLWRLIMKIVITLLDLWLCDIMFFWKSIWILENQM